MDGVMGWGQSLFLNLIRLQTVSYKLFEEYRQRRPIEALLFHIVSQVPVCRPAARHSLTDRLTDLLLADWLTN